MSNLSNLIIVSAQATCPVGVYWKLTYQPIRYLTQIMPACVKYGDADMGSSRDQSVMFSALIRANASAYGSIGWYYNVFTQ